MKISSRSEAMASGFLQYFTGKPCKHGHLEPRITSNGTCLECARGHAKKHAKKYPSKIKARVAKYRKENREDVLASKQRWRDENRDYHRRYQREYLSSRKESDPELRERRRKYINQWAREWRQKPNSKCITMMRGMLGRMVDGTQSLRTEESLGYSAEDLKTHIESQFEDWMSWDNHGDWHIDHIQPIDEMIEMGINDPRIINALTNLRPLCAIENMSLGAIYRHAKESKASV